MLRVQSLALLPLNNNNNNIIKIKECLVINHHLFLPNVNITESLWEMGKRLLGQEGTLFLSESLVESSILTKKWPAFLFLRSCRVAPLIQCDYCPLLFHMDCLEPPLTAMPLGRWMCPNHIEHVAVGTDGSRKHIKFALFQGSLVSQMLCSTGNTIWLGCCYFAVPQLPFVFFSLDTLFWLYRQS